MDDKLKEQIKNAPITINDVTPDIKLVTEDADTKAVAEKMATDIRKMYEDRDKKAEAGWHHLLDQLEVMAQKCRTANGVMMTLGVVRDVFGDNAKELMLSEEIDLAKGAANEMSRVAWSMYEKAQKLTPDDAGFADFCDGFYNAEFSGTENDPIDMVSELMRLQLCQQVGPAASDLFEFCTRTDEEIERARQNLREYCEDNDIDFDELCGPHDMCPTCLCAECVKGCKENRQIEEGQSAYDVCEKFEKPED